jgi:MFS superfamily sulfate permease-like transporter
MRMILEYALMVVLGVAIGVMLGYMLSTMMTAKRNIQDIHNAICPEAAEKRRTHGQHT